MVGSQLVAQQTSPSLDSPLTGDVSNDRNTMLHSFFALEPKRTEPIEYKAGDVEIVVQGTKSGIATINDKEILVYICSIASQKLSRGEHVSQKFRFTAHDFFTVTGKTPGGKTYQYFATALERLQGTQIKTNIMTGGRRERTWFSWLKSARMETAVWSNGQEALKAIEVELCDWLWRAIIDDKATLVSSDAYFYLRPMERKLYEVGYAECSDQLTATIPLGELRRRMGATTDLRHFRHNLAKTIANGSLKGFIIEFVYPDGRGNLVQPRRRIPLDRLIVRFERRLNVPLIDPLLIKARGIGIMASA
jgi:plasmid replication initiation protein